MITRPSFLAIISHVEQMERPFIFSHYCQLLSKDTTGLEKAEKKARLWIAAASSGEEPRDPCIQYTAPWSKAENALVILFVASNFP